MTRRRQKNPSNGSDLLLIVGVGLLVFKFLPQLQASARTMLPSGILSDGSLSPGFDGLGRTYVSGMGGMGMIGEGYNINEQFGGDASHYELARKFNL